MGSRRAVEVPRRRLGGSVGRAARRGDCDAVLREPAVRAGRPGAPAPATLSDVVVDLRVDDHALPIGELRRLFALHNELFGVTPPEDWLAVDEALAGELRARLTELGYEGELEKAFGDWAGTENLEERVDGIERVDPVVLDALRKQSG